MPEDLAGAAETDRDDLPRSPVREPQPAFVPTGRLDVREAAQEDSRLRTGWLPDGRLLVTGRALLRREPDGSMVPHVDLAGLSDDWNELVVYGRGNAYVNGRCDFDPGEGDPPRVIALFRPDGSVRQSPTPSRFPTAWS